MNITDNSLVCFNIRPPIAANISFNTAKIEDTAETVSVKYDTYQCLKQISHILLMWLKRSE